MIHVYFFKICKKAKILCNIKVKVGIIKIISKFIASEVSEHDV